GRIARSGDGNLDDDVKRSGPVWFARSRGIGPALWFEKNICGGRHGLHHGRDGLWIFVANPPTRGAKTNSQTRRRRWNARNATTRREQVECVVVRTPEAIEFFQTNPFHSHMALA